MVSLCSISSDVLINITTFSYAIQKDKIMPLQEYTSKDFLTDFLRKVLNTLLNFNKDLLFRLKIWSNKLKVLILSFLYLKGKISTKESPISLNKETLTSTITQLKINKKQSLHWKNSTNLIFYPIQWSLTNKLDQIITKIPIQFKI